MVDRAQICSAVGENSVTDRFSFLDQMMLKGKVAMVTGAGLSEGKATALVLAQGGADLVLVANADTEMQETAEGIEALGRRVLGFGADATVPEEIEEVLAQTVQLFGKIDILVNHVSAALPGNLETMTLEMWQEAVDRRLSSLFLWCKTVGNYMVGQRKGKIINILSIHESVQPFTLVAAHALRGGMIHFARALAIEWEKYNVQVNTIGPDAGPRIASNNEQEEIPGEGKGGAADVGPLVIYLASPASHCITGRIFWLGRPDPTWF